VRIKNSAIHLATAAAMVGTANFLGNTLKNTASAAPVPQNPGNVGISHPEVGIRRENKCSFPVEVRPSEGQWGGWSAQPLAVLAPGASHYEAVAFNGEFKPSKAYFASKAGTDVDGNLANHGSLDEFTFNSQNDPAANPQFKTWGAFYDESNVNGATNLDRQISGEGCYTVNNPGSKIVAACPEEYKVTVNGEAVACSKVKTADRSNFFALGPARDTPDHPVAKLSKEISPDAYSWSKDPFIDKLCNPSVFVVTYCP
jgi:hypothetical protein